ncbi:MAG: hypothetical protein K0S39_2776, partial [Paenibacillus sp.]|nr:hypothetical protein [Paenibacillus sp.]
ESAKSALVEAMPLQAADQTPPAAPTGLQPTAEVGKVALQWSAVPDADHYFVYVSSNGGSSWDPARDAGLTNQYTVTGLVYGTQYSFAVTAVDASGNESAKSAVVSAVVLSPSGEQLPPDPGDVATDIPSGSQPSFASTTEFLYTGSNPVQSDVTPGAIKPQRTAVLRGKVLGESGEPLPGVKISILGHDEFGYTVSREDGMFDMAVNGGGILTVDYVKEGFASAQRKADAPWENFLTLPDVMLKAYDSKVTKVELKNTLEYQVAQGTPQTDADGSRTATLLVPPGTAASMKLADGTTVPLDSIHVRATEYTVGENGAKSMPGELPNFVGYTYAVELSADEAVAAGATEVRFSQPLYYYVENFLQFPVGEVVPVGYYDRQKASWIPSKNGKVIQIISNDGSIVSIDTDNDGQADNKLNITEDELKKLAQLYAAGQTLWRVPIEHFTPWDCNWPYGPPNDANSPTNRGPNQNNPDVDDPCPQQGSIIGCQDQTLGETIPITGTGLSLNYNSRRSSGYTEKWTLSIPVSDAEVPSSMKKMSVVVEIAGKSFIRTFAPVPNLTHTFKWDGKDAYGRQLTGAHPYKVTVNYHWTPVYYSSPASFESSFGRVAAAGAMIGGGRQSETITTSREWRGLLDSPENLYSHIGIQGWSFDVHHVFDRTANTLELGTGSLDHLTEDALRAEEILYRGDPSNPNSEVLDAEARVHTPSAMTVGTDGSLIYDATLKRVWPEPSRTGIFQSRPDGVLSKLAEVTDQTLVDSIAVDEDGTLYASGWGLWKILKKRPGDSSWTVIAGTGTVAGDFEQIPQGAPATSVKLYDPENLQIGKDGSLYYLDNRALYQISPDGLVYTLGKRAPWTSANQGIDNGPLTQENLGFTSYLDKGPDGSLYVLDSGLYSARIRKISPEGTISKVAGTFDYSMVELKDGAKATDVNIRTDHFKVDRYGNIYFVDEAGATRLYRITPYGSIEEVAADFIEAITQKVKAENGDYGGRVLMDVKAIGPEGDIILQVHSQHSQGPDTFYMYRLDPDKNPIISNSDGTLAYEFDPETGRHVRTMNALTGGVAETFGYDADGRLSSITDKYGSSITIERSTDGIPTAIVAPGGQRTKLTVEQGQLTAVENPAAEIHRMKYDANGLLTQFTDPNKNNRDYGYDAAGYLIRAENPLDGVSTIERTDGVSGYKVKFTKNGLATSYEVNRENGETRRVRTEPTGAQTVSVSTSNETVEEILYPDGTKVSKKLKGDPRWGMDAPVIAEFKMTTPEGRSWTLKETRTVQKGNPANRFNLKTLDIKYSINNSDSSVQYDAVSKTFTETSKLGRKVVTYLDAKDRVAKIEEPGTDIAPIMFEYDAKGRLQRTGQGDQYVIYSYDNRNRLQQTEDASGHKKIYEYDDADRLIAVHLPGEGVYRKEYDDNGNLKSVTMPDQTVYRQQFNGLDQLTGFGPDGAQGMSMTYTSAGKLDFSTLMSGRITDYGYDAAGRINAMNDQEVARSFTYKGSTDLVSQIKASNAAAFGGASQTIDFTYDGSDVKSMTWSGKANGKYEYTYDNLSNLTNIKMTVKKQGTSTNIVHDTALGWDSDNNLTKYGPLSFIRSGPGTRIGEIKDENLNVSVSYDKQGRVDTLIYSMKSQEVYRVKHVYNVRGLLDTKTVITPDGTETYVYGYDDDGQLISLTQTGANGTYTESYGYDDNRNRTSREVTGSTAETAVFGDYGKLQQVGWVAYEFDNDGYLKKRGNDEFRYGTRGELLEVLVNGAETIRYTYDGIGRRTAREDQNGTIQYLYGNPMDPMLLTASINSQGDITEYYYNDEELLVAIGRGNEKYYVVTDGVGTPLRVMDANGTIVKKLRYDSFGVLLEDSNPGFELAIGFAGGVKDEKTKLVRFGFRDFDPAAARWTARDPILYDAGQGNLYAYVNNNPVQLRDPCGLFCIGFTAYTGLGGGGKVCFTDEGVSGCGEVGVGVGGGLEVNPFEDLSKTELTAELTGKVSFGPASLTVGGRVKSQWNGDCLEAEPVAKFEAGPFSADLANLSKSGVKGKPADLNKGVGDIFKNAKMGFKGEAALKAKACGQYRW